jgi:hypothetical protein
MAEQIQGKKKKPRAPQDFYSEKATEKRRTKLRTDKSKERVLAKEKRQFERESSPYISKLSTARKQLRESKYTKAVQSDRFYDKFVADTVEADSQRRIGRTPVTNDNITRMWGKQIPFLRKDPVTGESTTRLRTRMPPMFGGQ